MKFCVSASSSCPQTKISASPQFIDVFMPVESLAWSDDEVVVGSPRSINFHFFLLSAIKRQRRPLESRTQKPIKKKKMCGGLLTSHGNRKLPVDLCVIQYRHA